MTTENDGYETGARFRAMEERGWDPGNTYLALMVMHSKDTAWVTEFERGLNGVSQ